jgi:hypothetical protein
MDLWNVGILPQHYMEDGDSIDLWKDGVLPQNYTEDGGSMNLRNVGNPP